MRMLMIVGLCLQSSVFHFQSSICQAQIGTWRAYMSYYEPQQIVKAGDHNLFVKASNSLYQYNMNDQSITTYDKTNQLNDTRVEKIAWNTEAGRLMVLYDNANIDLVDLDGKAYNISGIFKKSMTQSKKVNCVYMHDKYAYIGLGFGIVKVNMERAEVAESYILNTSIVGISIAGSTITAFKEDGNSLTASLTRNLIDIHNWSEGGGGSIPQEDTSDWDQYIELVKTLKPDGPKHNFFGFMKMKDKMLYTCSGTGGGQVERPATVQLFDGTDWTILQDDMTGVPGTDGSGWVFVDMYSIDVDPRDSKHIMAGGRPGLFEYQDGKLVKYYNKDNSILNTATSSNKYVLVQGVLYDPEANFWLLQSQVKDNSVVEQSSDGEWHSHYQDVLMSDGRSLSALTSLIMDSRGLLWFINKHYDLPSFYCFDRQSKKVVNYMTTLVNQDGTTYEAYNPHCIVEDLDGNLWLGTGVGLFEVEASMVNSPLTYVTQVKVPRNDGTNYADYLMAGVNISCIAVDGANRKWIGTNGAGVYLISADNMEQLQNFTTSNSPLLSDNVESIAIDNETGEVFFGTDQGLCSYMSDATESAIEMVKGDVYAYPNPVVGGYDGLITVVGLTRDADVKILTVNGQLVAQGRSNGGTFTWNGRDRNGRRVASGVYMVATATSDGKKGTVCKIAVIN